MKNLGYSGTPLIKKLGIKDGFTIKIINSPENYLKLLQISEKKLSDKGKKDFIHYFTDDADQLKKDLSMLRSELKDNGMIWVSWPKKASGIPSNISEDAIRILALANGLIDIKVCAIDEIWSALKLVIPVSLRNRKGFNLLLTY